MKQTNLMTSSLMLTGAIALSITLTGCGSNPLNDIADKASETVAEKGAEKVVEGMTGGEMDIEFDALPAGFPEEVPLVSTNVVSGMKVSGEDGAGDGFVVSVIVDRDPQTVAEDVKESFADWEEITAWSEVSHGGGYTNENWGVIVGVVGGDSDQDTVVGYTVIPVED